MPSIDSKISVDPEKVTPPGIFSNSDAFWAKWIRDYFPSLIVQQKWHTAQRNLIVGDIVMIQDSNLVRGNCRLGRVSKTKPGDDDKVRNVEVQYKNLKIGKPVGKCSRQDYVTIERAVHRLVVILPVDYEDKSEGFHQVEFCSNGHHGNI